MEYKHFVVSDVHGYYDKMKAALAWAGFDENNENHTLITAGDMFDRGPQSKEIFEYLTSLERVVSIHGNHDGFLIDFLNNPEGHTAYFNFTRKGMWATIASFMGYDVPTTNKEANKLVHTMLIYQNFSDF